MNQEQIRVSREAAEISDKRYDGSQGATSLQDILERVAESHGLHKLGSGAEMSVFALEGGEYVAAISYRRSNIEKSASTSLDMKKRFYIQRVLATLFPHNFPKIYTSFGGHSDPRIKNLSGQIREKIEGKFPRLSAQGPLERFFAFIKIGAKETFASHRTKEVLFPFEKVRRAAKEMDLHILWDERNSNFILGADGGEYYVDSPGREPYASYPDTTRWDHEKILAYMKDNEYSKDDVKTVATALERMRALDGEHAEEEKEDRA